MSGWVTWGPCVIDLANAVFTLKFPYVAIKLSSALKMSVCYTGMHRIEQWCYSKVGREVGEWVLSICLVILIWGNMYANKYYGEFWSGKKSQKEGLEAWVRRRRWQGVSWHLSWAPIFAPTGPFLSHCSEGNCDGHLGKLAVARCCDMQL